MKTATSGLATAEEDMMKVIVYREYGSPHDVVELEEVSVPVVSDVEAGAVTPVIERTYSLHETAEPLDHCGEGHTRGKLVITMDQDATQKRGD